MGNFKWPSLILGVSVVVLTGALFSIRELTPAFSPDIKSENHPVILLCGLMMLAAAAWLVCCRILQRSDFKTNLALGGLLVLGLVLRLVFFDSNPVYENDYKRYLWDGAVTATGDNPYIYSPAEIFEAGEPGASSVPELARLAVMSNDADFIAGEINSSTLTTIYPPASQAIFAAAYWIVPFKPWGLKAVFLVFDLLGLLTLLFGLRARGLRLIWANIYWLNPVIIFTTYNGIHMDVLLVAPLLGALFCVGRRPLIAAILLSLAAAVKIWPLLLAPVLFRQWRNKPILYITIAGLVGGLTLLSLAPMLLSINDQSGLAAYSASWTNSSFLFPGIRDALGLVLSSPDQAARYCIAGLLTLFSLWLGFIKPQNPQLIPAHLMLLSGAFVFLSPTGYPWYFIWFLMFLPFAMSHWSARGLALLTLGAAAYFARFKIGDAGHYDIYTRVLLPLEFGIPLLVLAWDRMKKRPIV